MSVYRDDVRAIRFAYRAVAERQLFKTPGLIPRNTSYSHVPPCAESNGPGMFASVHSERNRMKP